MQVQRRLVKCDYAERQEGQIRPDIGRAESSYIRRKNSDVKSFLTAAMKEKQLHAAADDSDDEEDGHQVGSTFVDVHERPVARQHSIEELQQVEAVHKQARTDNYPLCQAACMNILQVRRTMRCVTHGPM